MVNLGGMGAKRAEGEVDAPKFERVEWKKEPHLRKLYFLSIGLMIAAATTGYDGYDMHFFFIMESHG